jgi:YfiH family protein
MTLPLLHLPGMDDIPGLVHGVSTRHGGVSGGVFASLNLGLHVGDRAADVVENRRRLCAALGLTLDALVVGEQVHGVAVGRVGAPDRGRGARDAATAVPGVDALVTATPELPLLLMVADCAPVLLVDPLRGALGVAHAGWRGALGGVAAQTARAMIEAYGCRAPDLHVAIGPHIGAADYEVGADVAEAVAACERAGAAEATRRWLRPAGNRWSLDLSSVIADQLVAVGVPRANICADDGSTATDTDRFYSYRAEGRTGRFGLLAAWRPAQGASR